MKKIINAIIVVEGKSDVQFLESFIDTRFVITNGSDVPRETIEYLKELSKNNKIIVLTDPDSPGKRIRDILNNEIPNLFHAYVDKKECIKKHKVGVAESNKEHILKVLENNPQSVADFKAGKDRALGFLVGQAMKETKGKANPQMLNKMFAEELKK